MIKMLIIDDHAVVRRGLKQIVAEEPDMRVAGEAQEHPRSPRPRPSRSGTSSCSTLPCPAGAASTCCGSSGGAPAAAGPHPQHAPRGPIRLARAEDRRVQAKETAPTKLVKAIRKVIEGRKYSPRREARQRDRAVARKVTPGAALRPRIPSPSPDCFQHKVGDIAESLGLSVKTVSTAPESWPRCG